MPSPHIDADDPVVADVLAGILQLIFEAGGWLHPDAYVRSRDGQLSVHSTAASGEPLAVVPSAAMVRVGRLAWSTSDEGLAFSQRPDAPADATLDGAALDGFELELLYLMTALLNRCGKIPMLLRTHPALAMGLGEGLITAVRAFRPSFRTRSVDPASVLWSTRCLRLPIHGGSPEPVAVPVIDLIDHHSGGATVQEMDDALGVRVRRSGGDSACFLDYGWQRDAIGTALVYGFADHSAQIAHSAPLSLEIPAVGTVRISARGRTATGRLLPTKADRVGDACVISHLSFGPQTCPVESLMAATGWVLPVARDATAAIAAANLALAHQLASRAAEQPDHPAARILAAAAVRQASLLGTHVRE